VEKKMTANELDIAVSEMVRHFDPHPIVQNHMGLVGEGQKLEVYNTNPRGANKYYQWLACLTKLLKPKQVVELGAASGISTIMIATQLSPDAKFYSVDIDPTIAWKWMEKDYPQVEKILGDDLNMAIWPGYADLNKTDLWFIDSLHTKEQLTKEIKLYKPYWKRGAVVVFDDIRMEGLWDVWQSLPYDKCETTNPNHYSGFGHIVV
jgi:cephalosporin hydroxylase